MRRGFTLMELLAVVAVLGLIAGATAWSMADQVRQGSMADLIAKFRHVDEFARHAARRIEGDWTLNIDVSEQSMWRQRQHDGSTERGPVFKLPGEFAIGSILVASGGQSGGSDSARTRYREHSGGRVELKVDRNGSTASYAVELKGPENQRRWLLIAGLSGQLIEYDNDQPIKDIFAALRGGGPDAD